MNPITLRGKHQDVGNFSDPMMDCKVCKSRLRADKLIEEYYFNEKNEDVVVDDLPFEELKLLSIVKMSKCGSHDY